MDDNHTVSDGTSSASESSTVERRVSTSLSTRPAKRRAVPDAVGKKRKVTYYARKDEIDSLHDHVQRLQENLQKYERESPVVVSGLKDALLVNAVLATAVEQSTLSVAGTQSLMSAHTLAMLRSTGVVPLKDKIHLPREPSQRDAVLRAMYDSKLRSALQFMTERTRFIDLSVTHKQSEQFTLHDGLVATATVDVTHFTSGHSLRQVYDALMFFVGNQEMSISEKLGILTVRESDEPNESRICHTRFLSTVPGGLDVEFNIVMFAKCVDATADAPAFALGALDFVDHDDLYPYRPDTCARKELTGTVTLQEIPSRTGSRPTIVMTRWSYIRMTPPPFPISEEVTAASLDGMLNWCAVIPKIMKEQLSAMPPAPTSNA